MTNRRNLDVVKAELNLLDSLCKQFHDAHNIYYDELTLLVERETTLCYFSDKESDVFEYHKEVTNSMIECEARISDHIGRLLDKQSVKSHSSNSSQSLRSLQSAHMKEKAKVTKFMAEHSLFEEKIKLLAAEKQLQINLEKAKTKARERVFEELEKEQKLRLPQADEETPESFLKLPTPTTGHKHKWLSTIIQQLLNSFHLYQNK